MNKLHAFCFPPEETGHGERIAPPGGGGTRQPVSG